MRDFKSNLAFVLLVWAMAPISKDHPALPSVSVSAEVNRAWREGVTYGATQVAEKGCHTRQYLSQEPFDMKELSYDKPSK